MWLMQLIFSWHLKYNSLNTLRPMKLEGLYVRSSALKYIFKKKK